MSTQPTTSSSGLPAVGIFKSLNESDLAALGRLGEIRSLAPGETLVEQGEHQDALFLVLDGALSATCHSQMSTVSLGLIKTGETVGEMNILDPLKASATVRAQRVTQVWEISRENLERFCQENPLAGLAVIRELGILLTRRVRRASDKLIRQAEMAVAIYEWED